MRIESRFFFWSSDYWTPMLLIVLPGSLAVCPNFSFFFFFSIEYAFAMGLTSRKRWRGRGEADVTFPILVDFGDSPQTSGLCSSLEILSGQLNSQQLPKRFPKAKCTWACLSLFLCLPRIFLCLSQKPIKLYLPNIRNRNRKLMKLGRQYEHGNEAHTR